MTKQELLKAFTSIGLSPELGDSGYLNIARPDGVHCEFYGDTEDLWAFCATYTVDGEEQDLDFYLPEDLDLFVETVCKILDHKPTKTKSA